MTKRQFMWSSAVLSSVVLGSIFALPLVPRAAADEPMSHPKIHAAIAALKDAREELKEAKHDFGGHKKEAMEAVTKAIKQLQFADEYAEK